MDKRRRLMLTSRKKRFFISYSLSPSAAYTYLKINGVGNLITGSGTLEIEEGDGIFIYAYSNKGSFVSLNGSVVAENNAGEALLPHTEYYFVPTSNAQIRYLSHGMDARPNLEIRIETL